MPSCARARGAPGGSCSDAWRDAGAVARTAGVDQRPGARAPGCAARMAQNSSSTILPTSMGSLPSALKRRVVSSSARPIRRTTAIRICAITCLAHPVAIHGSSSAPRVVRVAEGRRPLPAGLGSPGPWFRWCRLDSHSVSLMRGVWTQTVLWAGAQLAQPGYLGGALPQRPDHAYCGRRGVDATGPLPGQTRATRRSIDNTPDDYRCRGATLRGLAGLTRRLECRFWLCGSGSGSATPDYGSGRAFPATLAAMWRRCIQAGMTRARRPRSAWYVSYATRNAERYKQQPTLVRAELGGDD